MSEKKHYDIFISYRREGGQETALLISERLKQLGYRVAYDIDTLRSGRFDTQILDIIRNCRDVIVVLGPGALERCVNKDDWVRQEVACALESGKNVIPVLLRDFKFPEAETLPADIRELAFQNGVSASMEHFDSTFARIRGLLKTRRSGVARKLAYVLLPVFVLAAAGLAVWRNLDELMPYPRTQEQRQHVGALIGNIGLMATTQDELTDAQFRLLSLAETSISSGDSSDFGDGLSLFKRKMLSIREQARACEPSPQLLGYMASMPVDLPGYQFFVQNFKNDISGIDDFEMAVAQAADPKNTLPKAERIKQLKIKRECLEIENEIFAMGVMGLFGAMSETSLTDLKKMALNWNAFPSLARTWIRDEKEIERIGEALCNRLEKALTELATITGNANVSLADETEAYRKRLIEMGATPEKAEEMIAKIRKTTELKSQLQTAETGLRQARERARVKFAPKGDNEPGMLWGKALRFVSLEIDDMALKCLEALRVRKSPEYPDAACQAMEAVVKGRGKLPFESGVMVTFFEPPIKSHAIYRSGDIVVARDGKPIATSADYRAVDGSKYAIYRLNSKGEFERLECVMPSSQPRAALVEITEH